MYISGFETATDANVLAGSIFEFVKRPSRISVGLLGLMAGAQTGQGANTFTFIIGDVAIARDAQIFNPLTFTAAGAGLRTMSFPDDFFIQNEPALPGDRLVLAVTLGIAQVLWAVIVTEVA